MFSAVFTEYLKILLNRPHMSLQGRNKGVIEQKLLLERSGCWEFSLWAFQACSCCFKLPSVLLSCLLLVVSDFKNLLTSNCKNHLSDWDASYYTDCHSIISCKSCCIVSPAGGLPD